MRRAAKVDANHKSVGDYLRAQGWSVYDLSQMGGGWPDYMVSKPHFAAAVEVKDGAKPPSARQLTQAQKDFKDGWQGPYIIALTGEQAHADLCLEMLRARHFFVPHQGE